MIPATSENIDRAMKFLKQKWNERATERGLSEPSDLSTACKFARIFAQKLFGGKLQGNWRHQIVNLNGKIIDLTGNPAGHSTQHDKSFWNNREHRESMRSCLPRVEKWIQEFTMPIKEAIATQGREWDAWITPDGKVITGNSHEEIAAKHFTKISGIDLPRWHAGEFPLKYGWIRVSRTLQQGPGVEFIGHFYPEDTSRIAIYKLIELVKQNPDARIYWMGPDDFMGGKLDHRAALVYLNQCLKRKPVRESAGSEVAAWIKEDGAIVYGDNHIPMLAKLIGAVKYEAAFELGWIRVRITPIELLGQFDDATVTRAGLYKLISLIRQNPGLDRYRVGEDTPASYGLNFRSALASLQQLLRTKPMPRQIAESRVHFPYGWVTIEGNFIDASDLPGGHEEVVTNEFGGDNYIEAFKAGWIRIAGTSTSFNIQFSFGSQRYGGHYRLGRAALATTIKLVKERNQLDQHGFIQYIIEDDDTGKAFEFKEFRKALAFLNGMYNGTAPVVESVNHYGDQGWISADGKHIPGDHLEIARKAFGSAFTGVLIDYHYNAAYKAGWVRIATGFNDFSATFDATKITRPAMNTLLKIAKDHDEDNYFFIDRVNGSGRWEEFRDARQFIRSLHQPVAEGDFNNAVIQGWITDKGEYIQGYHIDIMQDEFRSDRIETGFIHGWIRVRASTSFNSQLCTSTMTKAGLSKLTQFAKQYDRRPNRGPFFLEWMDSPGDERALAPPVLAWKKYDRLPAYLAALHQLATGQLTEAIRNNLIPYIYGWIKDTGEYLEGRHDGIIASEFGTDVFTPGMGDYEVAFKAGWVRVATGTMGETEFLLRFWPQTVSKTALLKAIEFAKDCKDADFFVASMMDSSIFKSEFRSFITELNKLMNTIPRKVVESYGPEYEYYGFINADGKYIQGRHKRIVWKYFPDQGRHEGDYQPAYHAGWIRLIITDQEMNISVEENGEMEPPRTSPLAINEVLKLASQYRFLSRFIIDDMVYTYSNFVKELRELRGVNSTRTRPMQEGYYDRDLYGWMTNTGEFKVGQHGVIAMRSFGDPTMIYNPNATHIAYQKAFDAGWIRVTRNGTREIGADYDQKTVRPQAAKALYVIISDKDFDAYYISDFPVDRRDFLKALWDASRTKIREYTTGADLYGWINAKGEFLPGPHPKIIKQVFGLDYRPEAYNRAYEEGWIRVVVKHRGIYIENMLYGERYGTVPRPTGAALRKALSIVREYRDSDLYRLNNTEYPTYTGMAQALRNLDSPAS